MNEPEFEAGTWAEQLPEIRVPATKMIGNPSRFTNIYVRKTETILLDEEIILPQVATIRIQRGTSKSLHDYTSDSTEARQGGVGACLRLAVERAFDGPVLKLGSRLIYDARWSYNGNLAHLIGHHLARLGYVKEKLGIDTKDCIVVLEKKSPKISHALFDMIGYETCETNRSVDGNIMEIDVQLWPNSP